MRLAYLKSSILCFFVILTAVLGSIAEQANAVVTRHDIKDDAYKTDEAQYPALFALYRTKKGHRDCIATLVKSQWAITAAHCTEDKPFVEGLQAGGYGVDIAGQHVTINEVVRHQNAPGEDGADLALLRFTQPLAGVEPIPVYQNSDEEGRAVFILGWGGTGDGLNGLSEEDGVFRIAENRIDIAIPGWLIWRFDDPRSRVGRALALEGISGPGDSGGPGLISTPKGLAVAGVSSGQKTFGRDEGLYGSDEYFVRLSDYAEWINGVTDGATAE